MHRSGWNINVRCCMVFITLRKITGKYIEITMSFSLFVCNSCFNKASNFNNISLFLSIFSISLRSSFQKNIYDITLQIDCGISKGTIYITYMYRGILMSVCVSICLSICYIHCVAHNLSDN